MTSRSTIDPDLLDYHFMGDRLSRSYYDREPIRQYRFVRTIMPSVDRGKLALAKPRNWLERAIAWWLRRDGRFIGTSFLEEGEKRIETWPGKGEVVVEETTIDLLPILDQVRSQMMRMRMANYRPSKIVMGPETYYSMLKSIDPNNYAFTHPFGLPTSSCGALYGLDIVVNPCIEGLAVG